MAASRAEPFSFAHENSICSSFFQVHSNGVPRCDNAKRPDQINLNENCFNFENAKLESAKSNDGDCNSGNSSNGNNNNSGHRSKSSGSSRHRRRRNSSESRWNSSLATDTHTDAHTLNRIVIVSHSLPKLVLQTSLTDINTDPFICQSHSLHITFFEYGKITEGERTRTVHVLEQNPKRIQFSSIRFPRFYFEFFLCAYANS